MTVILGIDPGSRVTGYGVIKEEKYKLHYLDSGCIRAPQEELSQRLLQIFEGVSQLMRDYRPNEVAIEQVFLQQNPNSALKLGHARGVAMVAAASHCLKISEYSAREIKQALAGHGNAQKEQVQYMVIQLLMLTTSPQQDAADALAIAICHSHRRLSLIRHRRKSRGRLR